VANGLKKNAATDIAANDENTANLRMRGETKNPLCPPRPDAPDGRMNIAEKYENARAAKRNAADWRSTSTDDSARGTSASAVVANDTERPRRREAAVERDESSAWNE